jgi:predicted metal-dependent peptidase
MDLQTMNHEMDRIRARVFIGSNSAFLGSLLCSLQFHWSTSVRTAATDGENLYVNHDWIMSKPFDARVTVLKHEIWHVAKLHGFRKGSRDPEIWNYACDLWINNMLEREGCSFVGIEDCWKDQSYGTMNEEEIYDKLIENAIPPPPSGLWGDGVEEQDIVPVDKAKQHACVANVIRAVQQAKMAKQAGNGMAEIEEILGRFLTPVVPWQSVLKRFFTEMIRGDFTWRKRNRRFPNMYMPGKDEEQNRIGKLFYYLDVSGSVGDKDVLRFNSEVKHIKDQFNPRELRMIQFTSRIRNEQIITENQQFEKAVRLATGGTSLVEVREHIIKHKPTAAVIFTDLHCVPMEPLPFKIPIVWIVVGSRIKPPFGQCIDIKEER